ncbi:MAG: sigma-70 family RNA polymerase sigma factor [Planctomycetes bacterium]|nr:sigma-70 family RNA polymerase sigma factor [Planctomycetota bacterium]
MDDRLLTIQYKCGSRRALETIYGKYKRDVLLVALGLLNDTALAEDVVHDVFVRFAEGLPTFRLTGSLKGYLLTCAVNQARNVLQARQRHQKIRPVSSGRDWVASPLDHLICNEQARQCAAALAELPMEQREVILLHMQGRMSLGRIAQVLGLPVNTAKSRYRYSMTKLRLVFKDPPGQSHESEGQNQAVIG